MRLITAAVLLVPLALVVAGCGGDNLSLCDGCSTPTPEATPTPTSTASTPTPTLTATSTPTPVL